VRECLAHIQRQTYPDFELILVPDEPVAFDGIDARVIASGPVLPNRKRQLAGLASTAPILAFIDDDAYPDPEWLARAMRHFDDPNVVACGGPAITPADDGPAQRASGAIFAAPIVTAATRYRYVPGPQRDVDALPSCNLLIRRDAFLRDAEASADLWPGEDILVCMFATQHGERIVYDPAVLVHHHRRNVFVPHLRQVWSYGLFRGFFLARYHSHRNLAYLAPSLFVLAHAVLFALGARKRSRLPALTAAAGYAALVAVSALREARAARASAVLVTLGIYLTHVTYGAGTIAGWLRERVRGT
jgi:glycosyltransferase involved in cell wall biosynthesis